MNTYIIELSYENNHTLIHQIPRAQAICQTLCWRDNGLSPHVVTAEYRGPGGSLKSIILFFLPLPLLLLPRAGF